MPTMNKLTFGTVTEIWGQAWLRTPTGGFRLLKVGDVLAKGDVVLTAQNAIVRLTDGDAEASAGAERATRQVAATDATDTDAAIEALNRGERRDAPAAGLGGGDGGALDEGLRVARIVEGVTPAGLRLPPLDGELRELPRVETTPAPELSAQALSLDPLTVTAFEQGPNVAIGLTAPTGTTQIRIDSVPAVGQLVLASGAPVTPGMTLTPAQLSGLVYVPPADYLTGTPVGDVRYTASNGPSAATGLVTLVVVPVNDAPVATGGASTGNEDTTLPVALSGTDVDGAITGVRIDQLPSFGTLLLADGVTPVAAGQVLTAAQAAGLQFRPDPNASGATSIGFTVIDDAGAASARADWTISVLAVNDPPLAVNDSFTVAEDGSAMIAVLGNDSDAEGSALTITHVDGQPIVDGGSAVAVANGSVRLVGGQLGFTPAANYNGPAGFSYTVSDGLTSSTGQVSGTVTPVNDPPIANPDTFTVAEDGAVTIDVRGNDADVDGTTLVVTQLNGAPITDGGAAVAVPGGSVRLLGGQLVFTPAPDFNGPVAFTYTVSDGTATATAGVSGTVTPVDDAPLVTAPAAQAATEDTALVFSSGGGNGLSVADADGGALTLTISAANGRFTLGSTAGVTVSGNGSGSVVVSGDAAAINATLEGASFTPNADFNGTAGLSLSVHDGTVATAAAMAIQVTPVVDAIGDTVVTDEDTPIAINVLANDTFAGSSPAIVAVDGQLVTSGGAAVAVANGSVALNVLGQLVFTPTLNYHNTAATPTTFTYTVGSGGSSETASVSVVVNSVPDVATVTLSATPSVAEGGTIVYTATLSAPAFATLTVTLANGATLSIPAGASSASVSVPAPGDDAYVDAGSVSTTIASAVGGGFDVLNVDPAAALTTITDTIDTTTVSLSASASVAEGGFITYTAALTSPAQTSPVSVTLSNGATITIAVGASSGTVSVPAPTEDVYLDAGSVSATISTASGGNFENLVVNPAATVTSISDTIDTTTVSLGASASVAEGGFITYTASLTSPAQTTPVSVTLSNGATITIAVGASSGTVSVPAPTEDVYLDAGSVSATISSASGGNFESLAVNPAAAVTTITDTIDATTVSLSASANVAEGGSITYTATLTSPAQTTPVTVALSNGATITIAVGASSGSVSVAAPVDDVYLDAGSVSATISSATGGNFENLVVDPAAAVTAVTDTLDATTVSLSASASVAEGGFITYTASLTSPAQTTPVTVTLSNGVTIIIAAGSSSGIVSVAAPTDDVYLDGGSVSTTISSASGGNFESLAVNPAAAVTAITDTIDTTTVSLSASANVVEGGSITYTATLTSPAQTTPVTVALSNGATITIAVGASSGTVSVPAPTDDVYLDAGSVSATIDSASGGNFESLAVNPAAAVTAISDTLDTTTLSIAGSASIVEGASASYTLSLTSPAQSTVTVTLAYSGNAVDGTDFSGLATVTIPAGASSANFSLATIDDALAEGAESFTVSLATASGGNFENLALSAVAGSVSTGIVDNDVPSIAVTGSPTVEGGFAVFTVSLSLPSTSPITFAPTLASGSATVGTDTGTALEYFDGSAWVAVTAAGVTFAPGSTAVQLRVATLDDPIAEGSETFTLTASVTAGVTGNASATGTATITDEAVPGPEDTTILSLGASASVAEGGTITYTATLTNPATTAVTVDLSNGATITIAAGATTGSASVAAPTEDVYLDAGNVSATIVAASGGSFENLVVDPAPAATAITDTLDATTVSLAATAIVAEGGFITYTAALTSPAQNTPVTITLSNGATIVIAAGASSGTLSVAAPTDDVYVDAGNVSVTITTATGGNFEQLVVDPTAATTAISDTVDTTTVSLSATPSVAEGGFITYTAALTSPAQTSPVSVTLSNGATITIAVGASSGTVSVAAPTEDVYVDAGSVSATISSASGGNFENLAVNPAAAVTTVTDTIDTTTVSLSASASVAEGGFITYTASLTSPAQTTPVSVTLSNGATITIAVGASSGAVSVAAPTEDVYVDAGSVSATISSATGGNFENLAVNPAAAVTTITDTLDTTTVSLSASASVAEGGSITYTAALTSAAQTAVSVTLSNGATITIAAGASSGTVSVPAPTDDVYIDGGSVSTTISSASGGNFENLVVDPAAAVTTITDTIDTTTVSLAASASVAEGGLITYTVSLTSPAQTTPVSVTLSNGATITIAVGASSGTVSVAAPTDDVYVDAGSVSATISSATGGNFENLAVNPAAASTTVTDTIDTTTVSLSASASVAEGGFITYTAALTSPAQTTPVSVTLSNGATITIAVGASSGTVSVAAPTDDVYVDAGSVSATIASASGGNFESLVVNPAAATTSVTDTIDTTTVTLSASPSVAEGGSIVYTAALTSAAASTVTVMLDNGATIVIGAGASSGSVSVAAPAEDVYLDAGSVSAAIVSATGGGFENLAANPAPATTTITDTLDATTVSLTGDATVLEGNAASYTVSLTAPAQTAVTVTLAYSGTAADGSDFTGVTTVTIPAGASSASFSVATIDDALFEGTESFTVALVTATGGDFEHLVVDAGAASVVTSLLDNDGVPSLSVSDVAAVEEGFAVFTIALSNASATPTTFAPALASGTATVGVDTATALEYFDGTSWQPVPGAGVTIPAGALSVQVRVAIVDDALADGGETFTLSANVTAGSTSNASATGTATISDEAAPDTVLVSLAGPASVAEGDSTGAYTVSLTQPAATAVTVNLNYAGSATNGLDYSGVVSVTIPAGATSATFTLPTIDDPTADSGETVVVTLGPISGGGFESIAADPAADTVTTTIVDETPADVTTVSLAATPSVAEGGAITYTASLTNLAGTPVTVTLSNGSTIVIAAGASSGTVSVAAPTDDVYVDAGNVSVTIATATGGNFEQLTVDPAPAVTAITDTIDTTTVSLGASASVTEGGFITYTASLTSPAHTSPVTVTLSNGAAITIAVGASSGTVSVPAPSDDVYVDAGSVSATISSASGGNFENLLVNPTAAVTTISDTIDTTTVSLGASASIAEGGFITYTAALTSPAQSTPVTVTLSNGATITIAVGASSGTVNVPAPSEDVFVDAGSVSATISSATGGNFENLAVNPAAAVTTITDTIDTTTVSLSASASVVEGGSITYTAALTSAAQTAVSVTLSNGATITIAAGASSGTVSVPAPSDDVYVDAGNVSATISSASGGNFENLVVNPAAAVTTITDTIDTTTVSLGASASVAEGGTITYTASLTSPAQTTPVTMTLSNGATITIAVGSSSGTVSVPAPTEDVYVDAGSVSATISSATGGNFENLTINPAAAVTTITDTLDTTTVSLSASASVAEGGFITYTASLTSPAQTTPVTVTLSNGATITIAVGASSGTVSIAAPTDDVYVDAGSVSATIASASGGNFESLLVNPAAATTSVTDTIDTTTVTLSASSSVAEGGAITYTASLTSPAQTSPVTLTLSNGATITIAVGSSSGTVSVPAPTEDVYVDAGSVSATISTATGGNFENLAVDPAAATTTITDTIDTTTLSIAGSASVAEGASASYTLNLTSPAQSAVTVTLAYSGTAADGTDFTGVATVTIPAGASSATFSVPTLNDSTAEGNETLIVSLVSASGGDFENLVLAGGASAVTTTIVDDDAATLSLSATPTLTEAGGTIVYTATLTQPALSLLTITLSNGATITIGAGASSGSVSVPVPASDDVYVDPASVSASISAISGGGIGIVVDTTPATTTIADTIDATTVSLSASASVAEGGSITYTASLTSPAQTAVAIMLSNGATLTIAAGSSSGSVSVAAPSDDVYLDAGSVSATIATATGGNFENLVINPAAAVTTVTDTLDTTTVSLSASASVAEGGFITYTASLTSPAQTTPVSVMLSNGATITIAAGASSGTVSVAAPTDDVYVDAGSVSATISSASGGNFENLAVNPAAATTTIADTIDTTTVSLSASASVAEGGFITYTAALTSAAQTTPVTVTLSNGATITIAVGASSGTVSVAAPTDDVYVDAGSVSATIASASGGNFESLVVNPAAAVTTVTDTLDTTTVTLSASPSVAEGGSIVYAASLTSVAQSPVTVTLSNGATITIAAGASSGTVDVAAPSEDVYVDSGSVSATIAGASGGGFESLAVNPAAAVTTITDTIDVTTLSLTGATSLVEGANGSYTVSLTAPAQTAVTVHLAYSGSAANGVDYTGIATVTIPAGASSASFNLATLDDSIDEIAAESFTVSLVSASGGNFENLVISGSAGSVTTAIVDNDPAPALSVSSPTVAEAGGFAQFTIALSGPSSEDVSVDLTLANGTATGGGVDFGAGLEISTDGGITWIAATSATIAAGTLSVLARTPVAADAFDEADETFTLTATRTAGSTGNASAAGTATIADDDPTPTLTIGNVSVNEAAGTATFTVTLSAASGRSVSVDYATANGTATAPADYAAGSGTLTFAPGQTSRTITVAIVDDATTEASETFSVALSNAANATIAVATGAATIIDNDTPPQGRDATVTTNEDSGYTFSLADFLMNDAEQGSNVNPSAVRIDSLPANGTLTLGGAAVVAGQVIDAAQIGTLVFTPAANANGVAYAGFNFSVRDASGLFDATPNAITVDVTPVNDPPVITSDGGGANATVSIAENTTAVTTVTATDIDVGQTLSYSIAGGADAARFTIDPGTGALRFAAAPNFEAPTDSDGNNVYQVQVRVADGNGGFDLQTIDVTVTGVNEAPVVGTPAVAGTEDTARVFAWADFAASDPEGSALSITVTSLPADGTLQFDTTGTGTWAAVSAGQTITQAQIGAGRLRFVPDANESGVDGYGGSVGNVQGDYARFTFTASDGVNTSAAATMRIDIAPVADATTITAAANPLPASTGLTLTRHDAVPGLSSGSSQTLANIEPAVENDAVAATSVITGISGNSSAGGSVGALGADNAYRVSGYIYLQAGVTYTFSGTYDDTLTLEIGGRRIVGNASDGNNNDIESFSGSYLPTVSGFYSLELITYNAGGNAGFANVNVAVGAAAPVALNTTNFNLYASAAALTAAPDTVGPFVSAADPNTGSTAALSVAGHYAQHGGAVVQGQPALLRTLTPGFGDSADNSERHTVTLDLSAAPAGTRVFVDANGDGAPDDGRIFTVGAGSTSVLVYDEDSPGNAAGGANWNLSAIVVDAPTAFTGSFAINAISRADEVVGGVVVGTTSATQALSVTMVAAPNLAPDVATAVASVSEEGLTNALPDTSGSPDTTNATTASGTISITDAVDGVADTITAVTLTAPATTLTSGGVPLVWSGSGTGTLTATAGATTVATLTIDTAGNYNFTLLAPIDHPSGGGENVLPINFGVQASDGVNTGSGTLTIDVEDDSPGTIAPITNFIAGTDTNLMIVLDLSGSMSNASGIPGLTRLQAAVQSINTLLDRYDEFGAVSVRLVTFSSTAQTVGATWLSVADAKAALATFVAGGNTNYDAALASAQTAFGTATGKLPTAQNISYFFSDGAPTAGTEIGAADETAWTTFLNNNLIRSFAIGMGTGVTQAPMDPIAFNGQSNENTNAVVVSAFDDLDNVLAGTIQIPPAGALSGGASFQTAGSMGADGGGYVVSLTIEGTTYHFDPASNTVSVSGGPNHGSFDAATSTLSVTTANGGSFAVDLDDGNYRYSAPNAVPASFVETMGYTVADADGDPTSSSVTVTVDKSNTIIGTASSETLTGTATPDYIVGRDGNDIINGLGNNDVLQGNAGADTLDGGAGNDRLAGGAGNDVLIGGLGADTFEWRLVDRGGAGTPAVDTINDFDAAAPGAGGDVLDLRDLLQGETSSASLEQYLDFNVSGGTTTIRISSTGGFAGGTYAAGAEDQRIVLSNVDIRTALGLGGTATDAQIIAELINRGKLLTDVPPGG